MNFTCQRPHALYLLLLLIPAIVLALSQYRKVRKQLSFFSVKQSQSSGYFRIRHFPMIMSLRIIFCGLAWICLVLAYSGLSWGTYLEPVQKNGNSVSLVFDISFSMNAQDAPGGLSRLQSAEKYTSMLLSHMKNTQVSVVLAKGDGVTVVPMTEDRSIVDSLLNSLSPYLMSSTGTSLGKGVRQALKSFPDNTNQAGTIWLFTDGDETDGQLENALNECIRKGVPVYIIGFGQERESRILAGDNKTYVYTALRSEKLRKICKNVNQKNGEANITDAKAVYVDSTEAGSALTLLERLKKTDEISVSYELKPVSRYQLFVGLAIMFFVLGFIVAEIDPNAISAKLKRTSQISMIFCAFFFTSCTESVSGSKTILESTWNWYQQKYTSAVAGFFQTLKDAEQDENELIREYASYDLAVTYLMQNQNEAAMLRFSEAQSSSIKQVAYASYYNAGIIAYRQCDYDESIRCFREALRIDGTKRNAKINMEIAQMKAEKEAKASENVITSIQEDYNHSEMENSVFQRIRENDRQQWKNSENTEILSNAQDF